MTVCKSKIILQVDLVNYHSFMMSCWYFTSGIMKIYQTYYLTAWMTRSEPVLFLMLSLSGKEEEKRRMLKRSTELLQEKTHLENRTKQLNEILAVCSFHYKLNCFEEKVKLLSTPGCCLSNCGHCTKHTQKNQYMQ